MKYNEIFSVIKNLQFDVKESICIDDNNVELFIIRPSEVSSNLRNEYTKEKNFQIWLSYNDVRKFRPNHLRILIDLNLRARLRPDLTKKLLLAFDSIFYREDPNEAINSLENEKFEYMLNSLKIIANLSQLFLVEQEYNYQESKFDPKTLFYQGWVREFIHNSKEIDNLCMSVARFQPPKAQYTDRENKKNLRKYQPDLKPLWYLENENLRIL